MARSRVVRVDFCGTRGSTPVSGPAHVQYGGNTSCVALSHDDGPPTLVLDAGTGLQQLTGLLHGAAFRGTILLTHLHWDHTHGLPFFAAGARPGHRVRLLLPEQGVDAETLLGRILRPPHFPIEPRQLGAGWTFGTIDEGRGEHEGFEVLAREIPHKGGRTIGYRVSDGAATLAYVTDHFPAAAGDGPAGLGAYHEAALALAAGADLLVHDAQVTAAEWPASAYLGHAAVEYAVGLAERAGARRLALFHHSPWRTDDELDAIVAATAGAGVDVFAAYDGQQVVIPPTGGSREAVTAAISPA